LLEIVKMLLWMVQFMIDQVTVRLMAEESIFYPRIEPFHPPTETTPISSKPAKLRLWEIKGKLADGTINTVTVEATNPASAAVAAMPELEKAGARFIGLDGIKLVR